ncbi:MAG: type II/IV secretion system protein [Ectothiorhodospiraceae bacterium]|nr:type II/IV secretion system protein [Chromatiales bacterium]MCP5155037.1 type II/IV secretion system protein [Ectothiorhodospiraceae bacterium]
MKSRKKIRLGDLLVENKIISQGQLEAALSEQKKSGRKLGRVLIDNGYLPEASLLEFLSRQLDIPYLPLKTRRHDPEVVRLIPEMLARRFRALALETQGNALLVGMADPTDIFAYDEIARIVRRPVNIAVVSESELLQTFDSVYRRTQEIESLAEALHEELTGRDIDIVQLASSDSVADAPVVRLIQSLFEDAVQIGASDLHIEPDETVLRIRLRVDGVLQEQVMDEKRIAPALVVRLKLMAGLDISEKRLPQDGRFSVKVRDHSVDVRISTMPVAHGESVVMRLLDQSRGRLRLDDLGMTLDIRRRFERAVSRPHGMVLVTGPTGSGKTTTLYAAINVLNQPHTKIITVEDPVEYRIGRINQVQVHPEIGLDFARVLRSALRQDPDVVLIGEMRDEETAQIGLRAAMTGHLVLSTLHTNDAPSTVHRLLDMGAEGYLVSSALVAVVAQRLVRRICESCKEPYEPTSADRAWLAKVLGSEPVVHGLARGAGCAHCNHVGYQGRVGVHELLEIDDPMRVALTGNDAVTFERLARQALGGRSLLGSAVAHAIHGTTTLEEAMRVAAGFDHVPGWVGESESAGEAEHTGEPQWSVRESA